MGDDADRRRHPDGYDVDLRQLRFGLRGSGAGGFQEGTGEPYANKCCFVLRFKDGVIVEGLQYNDTWHVAKIIHKEDAA